MSVRFEDLLACDGLLVYKTRGVSMRPMLRQNRDLVVIRVPKKRLEPMDVALYRRGEAYVLHRVIRVGDGYYLIRGDNTYALEKVPDSAVIGVMTGFQRNGKEYDAGDRAYRIYARFWQGIYPVRACTAGVLRLAKRVLKKMGVHRRNKTAD